MGIVSPAMIEAYGRYGISEQPGALLALRRCLAACTAGGGGTASPECPFSY